MKYINLLCFFLIAANLSAQTPFEGKIIYTAKSPEKPSEGELTIYFARPGIRLEIKEANKPDKEPETVIINLDSGKIFTLMINEKQFKESELKKLHPVKASGSKTIAGFNTQAVNPEYSGMTSDITRLFGNAVLYPASELYYPVPSHYKAAPEFMMIHNGKIVLGAEYFFSNDESSNFENDTSKKEQALFTVMANQVSSQKLDPSLFIVPADYKKWSYDYRTDSVAMELDSSVVIPANPPVKSKKKQPAKKNSGSKQKPVGRKNE